jgi:hypothetical protein
MAMNEDNRNPHSGDTPLDPELAGIYRAAAREEPPQHVDAAILAAARRATRSQPHSLHQSTSGVPESSADPGPVRHAQGPDRRWQVPLALAAVLVLSLSIVTLQREAGDLAPAPSRGEPAGTVELRDAPTPPEKPHTAPLAQKPAREQQQERARAETGAEQPAPADPAESRPSAASAPAGSRAEEQGSATDQALRAPQSTRPERAFAERASPTAPAPLLAVESPEKWGEKILDLRRQGRAAEADALLAEFRQRFPDHAVPEEWTR